MSLPWWEFVIRALAVYGFLLMALRFTGKRQIGQLAPFDFVLLLILSNSVQNSMNGGDNSLVGGLLLAAVLIGVNWVLSALVYRSRSIENLIEGRPEVLIHNGFLYQEIMKKEQISHHELESAIRKAGGRTIDNVLFAVLESNGAISMRLKENKDNPKS